MEKHRVRQHMFLKHIKKNLHKRMSTIAEQIYLSIKKKIIDSLIVRSKMLLSKKITMT